MRIETAVHVITEDEEGNPVEPHKLWVRIYTDRHPVDGHEYGLQFYRDEEFTEKEIQFVDENARVALADYLERNPKGRMGECDHDWQFDHEELDEAIYVCSECGEEMRI